MYQKFCEILVDSQINLILELFPDIRDIEEDTIYLCALLATDLRAILQMNLKSLLEKRLAMICEVASDLDFSLFIKGMIQETISCI